MVRQVRRFAAVTAGDGEYRASFVFGCFILFFFQSYGIPSGRISMFLRWFFLESLFLKSRTIVPIVLYAIRPNADERLDRDGVLNFGTFVWILFVSGAETPKSASNRSKFSHASSTNAQTILSDFVRVSAKYRIFADIVFRKNLWNLFRYLVSMQYDLNNVFSCLRLKYFENMVLIYIL